MNVEFDSGKNKITYREKELLLNNNEFKLAILLLEITVLLVRFNKPGIYY